MDKLKARRAGWALAFGILISLLPYLLAKIGSSAAPPLFTLLLPGEFLGIEIGGWNARVLTVCLTVLTNVTLYTSFIFLILTKLENWKQAKRNTK